MSAPCTTTPNSLPRNREQTLALCVISGIVVLVVGLPLPWLGYAALFVAGISLFVYVVATTLRGRVDNIILAWIAIFPLGYYYLSFPREQPVMTLDRAVIGALLVAAVVRGVTGRLRIPRELRRGAFWWTAFLILAAITIPRVKTPLNSLRLLVEAFIFPGLLAWYLWSYFDVRKHLRGLHLATSVMAVYVCAIGIAEVVLQQDLLPFPGGSVDLAGDYSGDRSQIFIRPNGPFSSDNSFALVGLVSFCFLLFLRNATAGQMPSWQKWVHRFGVSAALMTALLPIFRSVFVALLVILVIDTYYSRGRGRALRVGIMGAVVLALLMVRAALPAVFEERADPMNIYGRIAQQGQTLLLFLDYPINGVGLNNFLAVCENSSKYLTSYQDTLASCHPHNTLGAVLAETGVTGFIPFVISQVVLFSAAWRLRFRKTADSSLAWRMSLYLLLSYWINAISLTSAYSWELNLWFMFAFAIVYKYGATQQSVMQSPAIA